MSSDIRHFVRRRNKSFKGYTLIEVLIAMVIFSSMVMLGTMALNQGLKEYHGLMEKGINFWDKVKPFWINKSFSSVLDYYVSNEHNEWFPYFEGDQGKVSYVSLAPLSQELPVVVWLIKERQDDGRYSLVYYELPVYAKNLKEIDSDYLLSKFKKSSSMRLIEDAENIGFAFYGYDFLKRKNEWFSEYDGYRRKLLPSLVRIEYYGEGHKKNTLLFSISTNSVMKAERKSNF